MWRLERLSARIEKALAAVAISLVLASTAGDSLARTNIVVTDVRVGEQGGKTRLVLDLDQAITFSVFTLSDPYRVVIDLPEVGWRLPVKPLPYQIGIMEKLRYGLFKPGNSRVVLDIRGPATIDRAFLLEPGSEGSYRLVVDLAPTTPDAFSRQARGAPLRIEGATAGSLSEKPEPANPPVAALAAPTPSSLGLPPRKPQGKSRSGRQKIVMLDPGHGGIDPGTIGASGTYEKHVTLAMAKEVKRQLERTGRYKVLLTRDRDIFIRLRDRVAMARDVGADLFVSIHADAIQNQGVNGPSVYTLSEKASDREAAELAEKENKADLIAGLDLTHESPEVTNILIDLAQRETMNQSAHFAAGLVKEIGRETKLLRNTHRFAGFAVLKAPDVPSVLLELGFLSNPRDEKALSSQSYRTRLAIGVLRAIDAYFSRVEEASRK
jgi:N-acetylmuramoyl-L-alanine amidase